MSVDSGGSICVCVCVRVAKLPLAPQQLARELAFMAVIHTEEQNEENLAFLSSFMSSSG